MCYRPEQPSFRRKTFLLQKLSQPGKRIIVRLIHQNTSLISRRPPRRRTSLPDAIDMEIQRLELQAIDDIAAVEDEPGPTHDARDAGPVDAGLVRLVVEDFRGVERLGGTPRAGEGGVVDFRL